jgi:hypothetical protein
MEILELKLMILLSNFNAPILFVTAFGILWIILKCFREVGYGDLGWDYRDISESENKIVSCILIICILLTLVLVNPYHYMNHWSFMSWVFKDLYEANEIGYLIMFTINDVACRFFSVSYLAILAFILCKLISYDNRNLDYFENVSRYKFVNALSIVILCLAIQICAYMLIPSNSFIFSNMLGWDL